MRSLYGKLALVLTALLIAVGITYLLAGQALTRHYTEKAYQQINRDLARNLVADRQLVSAGKLDKDALADTFKVYMTINPSIEIYLLDRDGTILTYSAEPSRVKRMRVSLDPIRAFLADNPEFPLLGDDPRSHDRQKSFSVTPLPSADNPEGYLYVVLRGESYDSFERFYRDSLLLRLSLWTLTGSLLFGLLTGLVLFYLLTRRLRRLSAVMAGFRDSGFHAVKPYRGNPEGDEVDRLGYTFNRMAERMQTMLGALQKQDTLRRELVNNVSHDLRTPLTCLHGYLETLSLKGEQLTAAERDQHLSAALRHSQRLDKLIGELFELAKLDARAVEPRREPFSAAELLQDVGQKFQLAAHQRGVELRLRLKDSGLVYADLGLIERVLENLISNALEHTPAGGKLLLRLRPATQGTARAELTVADNGSGIDPHELPHIFERSYRGARRDGDHAGLGLAIAKRIVNLHDSELKVFSQPGRGTQFSFGLPLWRPV